MNNKNLVVGAQQHLTTQVKTANLQLLISSQLMLDIERKKFVEILKRIDKEQAVAFLSGDAYFNEELIEKYEDKWNWGWSGLSSNKSLPWSLEFIERFEDKWHWKALSRNKAMPWSLAFIEKYEDKWDWKELTESEAMPWSLEFIERFEDKWEWFRLNQNAIDCLPKLSLEDIDEVMAYHSLSSNSEEYYDDEYDDEYDEYDDDSIY